MTTESAVTTAESSETLNTPTIHGAWSLLSYDVEVQSSGTTFAPMGQQPTGYVIFTPEGRLSFTLSAEGRQHPQSINDQAKLFSSMIAYTGTYHLDPDRWITEVDVAWNPDWVGTQQIRFYRIVRDQLTVTTPWRIMPNWPDEGLTRSIVRFQRCKASQGSSSNS